MLSEQTIERTGAPCPECGTASYPPERPGDYMHCLRCGLCMPLPSWTRLSRASALLRAVEGLDGVPLGGDPYLSVMHNGASLVVSRMRTGLWEITSQRNVRSKVAIDVIATNVSTLADALIALAVEVAK